MEIPRRQEQKIAPRHERVGQAILRHDDLCFCNHCGIGNVGQHRDITDLVRSQFWCPFWKRRLDRVKHARSAFKLNGVALTIIKADGFNTVIVRQRMRQTNGRILTT